MTGPGHWDLVSAGMNAKMTMTCFAYKWELSAVGYYRGILITAEAVQADPRRLQHHDSARRLRLRQAQEQDMTGLVELFNAR
jgi:hypothetical protein